MFILVFCFKPKTAYELRISDWSSDVCSSDLVVRRPIYCCLRRLGPSEHVRVLSAVEPAHSFAVMRVWPNKLPGQRVHHPIRDRRVWTWEIGRASCRERVCQYV